MRGDFSRVRWGARDWGGRPMLQQGRVLLDADFNAQGEASARALRQLTRDMLGPHAGPADALGFKIAFADGSFTIAPGRYYVDGVLAANEPRPGAAGDLRYELQEGFPFVDALEAFEANGAYFLYLDVWERSVTWFEDAAIREIALGWPDTIVRREVVCQVRAVPRPTADPNEFDTEEKASAWLSEHVQRHPDESAAPGPRLPMMRAFVDPKDDPDETPCVADPLGGFTGLENQLYRVEIHAAPDAEDQPATGALTFKWSRDNGSVAAARVDGDGEDLVVDGVRDTAHGFSAGQWVEITDRLTELRRASGPLVRLIRVEGNVLTYDPASAPAAIPAVGQMQGPIIRRWDHRGRQGQSLAEGAIVLREDTDYTLERGVKIRFPAQAEAAPGKRRYAVGDHWTFPARTATADIEWPFVPKTVAGQVVKDYVARPPDGIEHAYAPLAVESSFGAGALTSLQRTIKLALE